MSGSRGCGVCGVVATMACGGCSSVMYCGRQHQRQHWPEHKPHCQPFAVNHSPTQGKYLVASRNLKEGQLIFRDVPLAVGPLSVSPLVCLGCHSTITATQFPRCSRCYWPLCSELCGDTDLHQQECAALAKDTRKIGPPTGHGPATLRYDSTLVLRCLSLQHDEDTAAWDTLMDMVSHGDQYEAVGDIVHTTTQRFLTEVLGVAHDSPTIRQVRGAITANSMEIRTSDGTRVRAMYPRVRLINHSCLPNVQLRSDTEGVMEVRAAVAIQRGDPLYITYTGTSSPLWERQRILSDTYCFKCECTRCTDPTELGLYYSSVRCPECPGRFLEPHSWVDDTVWRCDVCSTEQTDAEVQGQARERSSRLDMDDVFAGMSAGQVERTLTSIEDEFHATHHVWLTTAQVALRTLKDPSEDNLRARSNIWQKLLDLFSVLEPGLSRRRGIVLLEAGISTLDWVQKEMESGNGLRPQLVERLQLARDHLQAAEPILALEPPRSPVAGLADKTRKKLDLLHQLSKELGVELCTPGPES